MGKGSGHERGGGIGGRLGGSTGFRGDYLDRQAWRGRYRNGREDGGHRRNSWSIDNLHVLAKGSSARQPGGAGLSTPTSLAFKGCAVSGITVAVTITGKMPLNATSYNATTKVASMTITKIHGTFSVSAISCTATIDGTGAAAHNGMVKATFSNTTDTLKVLATGGNLHIYNPSSGCNGAVGNNDAVNFTGGYKLTPKQTITSP